MKVLLCILVLCALCAFGQDPPPPPFQPVRCTQLTCASLNQTCNTTIGCVDHSRCSSLLETGTCIPYKQPGENCTVNWFYGTNDCIMGGQCVNGTCTKGQGPGSPCSKDNECYLESVPDGTISGSGPVVKCVNRTCYGLPEGATCTKERFQCMPPLWCANDGVCRKPAVLGAACTMDRQCQGGTSNMHCSVTPTYGGVGQCVKGNTFDCNLYAAVDQCSSNFIFDDSCTPTTDNDQGAKCKQKWYGNGGYFCWKNEQCADGYYCTKKNPDDSLRPQTPGVCMPLEANSLTYCEPTKKPCTRPNEVCSCIADTGYMQCAQKNFGNPLNTGRVTRKWTQCAGKYDPSDLKSIYSDCVKEFCDYFDFKMKSPENTIRTTQCLRDDRAWYEYQIFLQSDLGYIKYSDCYNVPPPSTPAPTTKPTSSTPITSTSGTPAPTSAPTPPALKRFPVIVGYYTFSDSLCTSNNNPQKGPIAVFNDTCMPSGGSSGQYQLATLKDGETVNYCTFQNPDCYTYEGQFSCNPVCQLEICADLSTPTVANFSTCIVMAAASTITGSALAAVFAVLAVFIWVL